MSQSMTNITTVKSESQFKGSADRFDVDVGAELETPIAVKAVKDL